MRACGSVRGAAGRRGAVDVAERPGGGGVRKQGSECGARGQRFFFKDTATTEI